MYCKNADTSTIKCICRKFVVASLFLGDSRPKLEPLSGLCWGTQFVPRRLLLLSPLWSVSMFLTSALNVTVQAQSSLTSSKSENNVAGVSMTGRSSTFNTDYFDDTARSPDSHQLTDRHSQFYLQFNSIRLHRLELDFLTRSVQTLTSWIFTISYQNLMSSIYSSLCIKLGLQ